MSQYLKPDPVAMQISTIKEMKEQGRSVDAICSAIGGTWMKERNRCSNYPNDFIDGICHALGGTIKRDSGGNLPMETRWCEIVQ